MKSQPVAERHDDPSRRARRRVRTHGPESPVFVDSSGRRARLLRRAGVVAGIALLGYATMLAVAFMGATPFAPETLIPGSAATSREKEQSNKGRSHKGNSASATPSLRPSASAGGAPAVAPAPRPSPTAEKSTASRRASSSAKASATATKSPRASGSSATSSASSSASSSEPPEAIPSASSSPSPADTDTSEDGATSEPGAVG
ncbi:hypothetical protein [Streptomyces sp. NPDC097640]|uniref:hypothetical protein n=1 Tax=Streptomyces sp. NPDC097640 TaxID=3157229 RepID=UPI0033199A85